MSLSFLKNFKVTFGPNDNVKVTCDQACQTDKPLIPILGNIKGIPKEIAEINIEGNTIGIQTEPLDKPICKEKRTTIRISKKNLEIKNTNNSLEIPINERKRKIRDVFRPIIYPPYIDPNCGDVTKNYIRDLCFTSIIDSYSDAGLINGMPIKELQEIFVTEFSEKPISLNKIRELLRSKQFKISKDDCVIKTTKKVLMLENKNN